MPTLKVQNLYNTTVTEAGWIPDTGDCNFTVASPPTYSNGFIIISPDNSSLREIMYYHDVIWNRIYVRWDNRFFPKAHAVTEVVKMNDVAEIFNTFSDMISQAFYVEKTGGLNVRIWWGYVYYNGSPISVPDTNLVLANNATNYIKYDYPTNTFSVDTVNSWNIKAQVITSSWVISGITYRTAKESYIDFTVALTGALPSQWGNAWKFLGTDGTNVSWQSISVPDATTTVSWKVEWSTSLEAANWSNIWWSWAILSLSPRNLSDIYYFWDGSDGDVTISVNTSLSRDMYYNNLTVNTGVTLDPAWYAIYVLGTLTLTWTAKIARNGNAASWVIWWAALATWTCWPCLWGVNWGGGGFWVAWTNGTNGVSVATSYKTTGSSAAWWAWWAGSNPWWSWWTSATHTQWSLYNKIFTLPISLQRIAIPSRSLLPYTQYGWLASSGSWWWWWWVASWQWWNWWWSWWNWGIILIFAQTISWSWTIEALWWTWWNGTNGSWTNQWWGGGGGGGGNGGVVFLVYRTWTPWTITTTGGAWWTFGTWINWWSSGTAWSTGTTWISIVTQV